jgi:CheY-like chemotaxis protein
MQADPTVGAERRLGVLAIDDEPLVARVIGQLLERDYVVAIETAARAALARVVAGEIFDVIVCDLMMPEMDGIELHAELLKVCPPLARRMVFLTGDQCTPAAKEFLRVVPNATLEKPFTASALRAALVATADAEEINE